jgi:hypothetical protein
MIIVARIAYDKLMKEHPHLIEKANKILRQLDEFTTLEGNYPFVECATFADEIKITGFDFISSWHFVDQPLFEGGFYKPVVNDPLNITWAIVKYLILTYSFLA